MVLETWKKILKLDTYRRIIFKGEVNVSYSFMLINDKTNKMKKGSFVSDICVNNSVIAIA